MKKLKDIPDKSFFEYDGVLYYRINQNAGGRIHCRICNKKDFMKIRAENPTGQFNFSPDIDVKPA